MSCTACRQINNRRLYHFLPKWNTAALNVSLADKGKLRRSSLSILMTVSSTVGLEIEQLTEGSAWCSRSSVSVFQNFQAGLLLLVPEPTQFNQNFAAKNVNPSPSTFAISNLFVTGFKSGTSIALDSDSLCDHNPALVIYTKVKKLVTKHDCLANLRNKTKIICQMHSKSHKIEHHRSQKKWYIQLSK